MIKKIIIVGVGETADIAYEYFTYDSEYEVVGFSVSDEFKNTETYKDLPLVALSDLTKLYPADSYLVFVALSSGKLNTNREILYKKVKSLGYKCATYISSRAFVWRTAKIGENCFIFENNVIQHNVEIGNNVILWSGNHIGHQSVIKDNAFISSHCVISGYCVIGENSFLGVNVAIGNNVTIGRDCFIGMGGVINKNIEENSLYVAPTATLAKITAKQLCKVNDK